LAVKLGHGKIRDLFRSGDFPEYGSLILLSLLAGTAAGLITALFLSGIRTTTRFFFEGLREPLSFLGSYYVVVPPVLGAVLIWLLRITSPRVALEGGLSHVMLSVVRKGGRIKARSTLFHFVASILSIGSGATLGPEDPASRLGAGAASLFGQLLRLSERKLRMLTAAGAGAAIAAAFGAPIGGVFFAVEIVFMNDLQTGTLSAVILASVTSSVTAQAVLRQAHPFPIPSFALGRIPEFLGYLVFGALAGLWSGAFVQFYRVAGRLRRAGQSRAGTLIQLLVVSLLLGLVGRFFPGLFGIGFHTMDQVLQGQLTWFVAAVLLAGKFLFVPLLLHAGSFGGIFAPSIFQGALLGYLFAHGGNLLLGTHFDPVAYSLVGMGAVLAGINGVPLTSIMIILEMTRNNAFLPALMTGVVVSHLVARKTAGTTPHLIQLEKRGVHLHLGKEVGVLHSLHVHDIFRPETNTVATRAKLSEVLEHMLENPYSSVFVVDDERHLVGVIQERDLRQAMLEYEELKSLVTAADLAVRDGTAVRMDDDLHFVLQQFARTDSEELPVVSDVDPRRVIGLVTKRDALEAYNRALARQEMADYLFDHLRLTERERQSPLGEGYVLEEIPSLPRMWGKTLKELNLRVREGVEVIFVSRPNPLGERERLIPNAEMVIQEDDRLLVLGKATDIERLRRQAL
jgi:CIC family chloride channel protein